METQNNIGATKQEQEKEKQDQALEIQEFTKRIFSLKDVSDERVRVFTQLTMYLERTFENNINGILPIVVDLWENIRNQWTENEKFELSQMIFNSYIRYYNGLQKNRSKPQALLACFQKIDQHKQTIMKIELYDFLTEFFGKELWSTIDRNTILKDKLLYLD